jgi:hypothetical protein
MQSQKCTWIMNLVIRMAYTILLSFTLFANAWNGKAYGNEKPEAFEEYIAEGNTFKCLLPKGWSRYEAPDYSRDARKVYGIEVQQGNSEHRIGISVKYYAGDNKLHKSAEKFIRMHSMPVFGGPEKEGERYGPVKEILIRGVKAKTFERGRYEFEDHIYNPVSRKYYEPMNPRKFPMDERYIVIPAKEGFYALRYKASPDAFKSHEGIFQRVLESFEPLNPGT